MKERAKRTGAQRKEDESERRTMQVIMIQDILYISKTMYPFFISPTYSVVFPFAPFISVF